MTNPSSENPSRRPPVRRWDVFLSHASEDKPYVRAVGHELTKSGLTVFLDENDLIAGKSLRGQIDYALVNSHLGLLFISPSFLAKRWPREEYDALFTLEDGGRTRILPVWLNTTTAEVIAYSPILASRLALRADNDPRVAAQEIHKHVMKILNEEGTWAQLVRIDTLCLPWIQRPRFLIESLRMLDEYQSDFWSVGTPVVEPLPSRAAPPLMVGGLIDQAAALDGQSVIVSGRQERVQFYERHSGGLAEYIFQLRTRQPGYENSIIYVRYVALEEKLGAVPKAPDKHLTTVFGLVIASGAMTLSNGLLSDCAYMVASKIFHTPELL